MAIQKPFSVTAKNQLQLATLLMSVFGGICENTKISIREGLSCVLLREKEILLAGLTNLTIR